MGLAGAAMTWLSLPPLGFWPIGWLAAVPWALLVRQPALEGRRPYHALWLAGFAYWFATLHFLRLPHPATSLGWVVLSAYLACYLPAFVAVARYAVHRWRWPLALAVPVVYTGLEVLQSHLFTGFNFALLSHGQYRWLGLIQIADLCGGYGVTFVMLVFAATLAGVPSWHSQPGQRRPIVPCASLLLAVLLYGQYRWNQPVDRRGPRLALIQGSVDTEFKADEAKHRQIHDEYIGLSHRALTLDPNVDVVIWPETMWRFPLWTHADDFVPPAALQATADDIRQAALDSASQLSELPRRLGKPMLLGVDVFEIGREELLRYNAAVLVDPARGVIDRYDKMHPVMFGEYIPLARYAPWIYKLSPLAGGLEPGRRLNALPLGRAKCVANVCFESLVPHLIRRQVVDLRRQGIEPDLLVNITNDGWFYGTSALDLHLIGGVFRAIECRKPFVSAANTGFSAWIDSRGKIEKQGPRRDQDVLIVEPRLDDRVSLYSRTGDVFGWSCAAVCIAAALHAGWVWRKSRAAQRLAL